MCHRGTHPSCRHTVHGEVVGFIVTIERTSLDELVAHGADRGEVVFHSQQHIRGTNETSLGELLLCLDEAANDQVLMLERETASCAEVAKFHAITNEADAFGVGLLVFLLGIVVLKFAFQLVHHFGDRGQDGHLPKHGAPQQSRNGDVQVSFLILAHFDFRRAHVEAFQEGKEP